jgi:hypothetical protein
MDFVNVPAKNTSTDEIELVYHNTSGAGGWTLADSTGGMLYASCDNTTDLVTCDNTNLYRRVFFFMVGWNESGVDNADVHQLAPSNTITYSTVANCLDTTTYPITYTLPTWYNKAAVPLWAYCIRPTDTSWTTNFIDLRTTKTSTSTAAGGIDTSIFLTTDGSRALTSSWNAGQNILAPYFIGQLNGTWNESGKYQLEASAYKNANASALISTYTNITYANNLTVYQTRADTATNISTHAATKHGNTTTEIRAQFSGGSNISITNGVVAMNISCLTITGSADLCDGSDATGTGGSSPFTAVDNIYIYNATGTITFNGTYGNNTWDAKYAKETGRFGNGNFTSLYALMGYWTITNYSAVPGRYGNANFTAQLSAYTNITYYNTLLNQTINASIDARLGTTYQLSAGAYKDQNFSTSLAARTNITYANNLTAYQTRADLVTNLTLYQLRADMPTNLSSYLKNNTRVNFSIASANNYTVGTAGIWNNGTHICIGGC